MSKTINPSNGYLLIEPLEEGESLAGNIILPDMGKEKPAIGTVLATSEFFNHFTGTWMKSNTKIGSQVLIPKMGSQRITLDGKEYFMCKELDALGTIIDSFSEKDIKQEYINEALKETSLDKNIKPVTYDELTFEPKD